MAKINKMATINIENWWKAFEIPLIETDWRSIRLYCTDEEDPFRWSRCVYIIRTAPPFVLSYGDNAELESPLIYVGRGNIRQRWRHHRKWLAMLGHSVPSGRYEVWVSRPRGRAYEAAYKDFEADILGEFYSRAGCMPLFNKRHERSRREHDYNDGLFEEIFSKDARYTWAMYPIRRGVIRDAYQKGWTGNGG
jgi:hypothetical protein